MGRKKKQKFRKSSIEGNIQNMGGLYEDASPKKSASGLWEVQRKREAEDQAENIKKLKSGKWKVTSVINNNDKKQKQVQESNEFGRQLNSDSKIIYMPDFDTASSEIVPKEDVRINKAAGKPDQRLKGDNKPIAEDNLSELSNATKRDKTTKCQKAKRAEPRDTVKNMSSEIKNSELIEKSFSKLETGVNSDDIPDNDEPSRSESGESDTERTNVEKKLPSGSLDNTEKDEQYGKRSYWNSSSEDQDSDSCMPSLKRSKVLEKEDAQEETEGANHDDDERHMEKLEDVLSKNMEDVDESEDKKYVVYEMVERRELLIHLSHRQKLSLWGVAQLQVVWGSVSVLGYTMTHTSLERWPVYSSSNNSLLTIETLAPDESSNTELCRNAVEQYVGSALESDKLQDLVGGITEDTIIISLHKLEDKHIQFVTQFSPFHRLFPNTQTTLNEDLRIDYQEVVDVAIVPSSASNFAMKFTSEMKHLQNEVLSLLEEDEVPKIALCGGQGAGKSTMARFLMNTILSSRKDVAYLECDVGQTEFTPSGCISLNIVRQPVLGPPFSHLRKSERMCYFGTVRALDNIGHYLKCIKYVYDAYEKLPEKPVLIINTMGWHEGLGLVLMADILRMLSPTLVVQITNIAYKYRNFPPLDHDFVRNTASWWDNQDTKTVCYMSKCRNAVHDHDLMQIKSSTGGDTKLSSLFRPYHNRMATLLSYLGQLYDNINYSVSKQPDLHSLRPYKVPWSKFALHVLDVPVPQSQILNAFNGQVVALCHIPETEILESYSPDLPDFLRESPACNCLGFGIVRSIDPDEKCFYLLTPVCHTDQANVNCLLKGALKLHNQILRCQPALDGHIPYVCEGVFVMAGKPIKTRRHLKRLPRGNGKSQGKQISKKDV